MNLEVTLDDLEARFRFFAELEKLKTITRGNRTLDERFENSAEHSWHLALMGILLAEYAESEIDPFKVVKMLLIHDIVEIDAGDTWLFSEDQSHKLAAEQQAAERIFGLLPSPLDAEYRALWAEFETRETAEAQFAAAVDGIQPLLNHLITGSPEFGTISAETVLAKKAYIKEAAPRLWPKVEALIEQSIARGLYEEPKGNELKNES